MSEENTEEGKATPELNPRVAAMNALTNSRNALLNGELEEGGQAERVDISEEMNNATDNPTEGDLEPTPPIESAKTDTEDDETETPPSEPVKSKAQGAMVSVTLDDGSVVQVPTTAIRAKLKIDGEESEISGDALIRDHQKAAKNAKLLTKTTALEKELEKKLQATEQRSPTQTGQLSSDVADNPSQTPSAPADVREKARTIANKLYSGDVEEVEAALVEVLEGYQSGTTPKGSPPLTDVNALATAVEARMDSRAAGRMFAKDFSDIVEDPFLLARADEYHGEVREEHPDWSATEVFKEAGTRTRNWLKSKAGVPADEPPVSKDSPEPTPPVEKTPSKPVTTVDMSTRRDRKAATTASLPSSGKVAGLGKVDEPPPSSSDVITEMKRARGQL